MSAALRDSCNACSRTPICGRASVRPVVRPSRSDLPLATTWSGFSPYSTESSSMHDLSVSVVMPTNRRAKLLHGALTSLFAQRHLPEEIVVAVDEHDEESLAELDEWGARTRKQTVRLVVARVADDS